MTFDRDDAAQLPAALRAVADELGLPLALKLANELGGTRLWLPRKPRPESALVKAMGAEDAQRIAELLGPGKVEIPLGPAANDRIRVRQVVRMLEEGRSHTAIARATRTHVRTVERYASRLRNRTPDLFSRTS